MRLPSVPAAAAGDRRRRDRRVAVAAIGGALLAAVVIAVGAGRAHVQQATSAAASRPAAATLSSQLNEPAPVPLADRMTYYLVASQEQAAHVQQELDDGAAEAFAQSSPVAPSTIVVISSPEEQAIFEAGINECASDLSCLAQMGTVVDLRAGQ